MTDKPRLHFWLERSTPEDLARKIRRDRCQARLDAFNALEADQQAAIRQTFKDLEAAQTTLSECQDLWLSDSKELDHALWHLRSLAIFDPENVDL